MNQANNNTVLAIVPSPLIPPVTKGQKHTYGLLDALGQISNVVCITDTKSSTAGHSFKLLPSIYHTAVKHLSFSNYRLIKRSIRQLNPDVILLEQPYMGFIINIISKQTQTPFCVHAHNVEFLRHKSLGQWWWPVVFWLERHTFRKAKAVFFISENDRRIAMRKLRLNGSNCFVSPYGVPQTKPIEANTAMIENIRIKHNISVNHKIIMFFGDMKYLQNLEALEIIINEIQPRLKARIENGEYKLLICGGGLSDDYREQLAKLENSNIIYTGYVHDIDEYFQCADVIINPIQHRGGIKIKLIEALGFNKAVVSTEIGALGIEKNACGNMLKVVKNKDWESFTNSILEFLETKEDIPQKFFEKYNWKSIAGTLLKQMLD